MSIQASKKHGVQSSSRKAATSRHGVDPQPRTRPVAGAFGREGSDRRAEEGEGPEAGADEEEAHAHVRDREDGDHAP